MRNLARVLAFDVLTPLAVIAGLLVIGVGLDWPLWWVSVCSMLCLLVAQAVIVDIVGFRRDAVTLGTDDDAPALRLAAVGVATATLIAAALVGYTRWTVPDRAFGRDTGEVVGIATAVAEATATFDPEDPKAAIDRAAAMMAPESAQAFTSQFGASTADLAKRSVTASARTLSAGLEALAPEEAAVTVALRATQAAPGEKPTSAVLALRVILAKPDGDWKVVDVRPANSR